MNIHNGADDVIESRNIRMDQSGLSIPKSLAISLLMLEPLLLEFVHFCAEKLFLQTGIYGVVLHTGRAAV